jgi:hypothetical protein
VIQAIVTSVEQRLNEQHAQVLTMQREFAHSVAAIVAEQVAAQTRAMEASIQARIESAVAPLQEEIQQLRQRVAAAEKTVGEFTAAISQTLQQPDEHGPDVEPQDLRTPEFPRSGEPVPIRSHQTPQHLDLRVLRKRLRDSGVPAREPHPDYPQSPAAPQRREPESLSHSRAVS